MSGIFLQDVAAAQSLPRVERVHGGVQVKGAYRAFALARNADGVVQLTVVHKEAVQFVFRTAAGGSALNLLEIGVAWINYEWATLQDVQVKVYYGDAYLWQRGNDDVPE